MSSPATALHVLDKSVIEVKPPSVSKLTQTLAGELRT